jgi:hypothetical protein
LKTLRSEVHLLKTIADERIPEKLRVNLLSNLPPSALSAIRDLCLNFTLGHLGDIDPELKATIDRDLLLRVIDQRNKLSPEERKKLITGNSELLLRLLPNLLSKWETKNTY